jgi:hypothetical protein
MTPDERMLQRLEGRIVADIPGYERLVKEDSGLMKFNNFFVQLFNKEFMTRYITTAYPRVYFPRKLMENTRVVWKVLAHEWIHLHHAKNQTVVLHTFLYGLPQWLAILAIFSLGAIWGGPWWLLNLCWLICAAPFPAYFRAREERSAYVTNMAVNYWRHGSITQYTKDWLGKQFYESSYYFMWPFKDAVKKWMDDEERNIIAGKYDNLAPYDEVRILIEEIWPESKKTRSPPSP